MHVPIQITDGGEKMTPSAMPPFRMNGDLPALRAAIAQFERVRIAAKRREQAQPEGNRKERRRQKALARKRS